MLNNLIESSLTVTFLAFFATFAFGLRFYVKKLDKQILTQQEAEESKKISAEEKRQQEEAAHHEQARKAVEHQNWRQEQFEENRPTEVLRNSKKWNENDKLKDAKVAESKRLEAERQKNVTQRDTAIKVRPETQQIHESENPKLVNAKIGKASMDVEPPHPVPAVARVLDPEPIKVEKEEQSTEKYIGYNPINVFAQSEPLNYPCVIMPKANCVIKFPRKGRVGRKGYKEEDFKVFVEKHFKSSLQVFDDRFILTKNSPSPFEPDFTLVDERNGINLFIDIEIDEPYEGLNDVERRKPTHFQYSDKNRNNAFKVRGWIVIRFAEIQVHQEPVACCRFIADVIKSVNPSFQEADSLAKANHVKPVRQWTKEEAETWSKAKYRETYLGIKQFGTTSNKQVPGISETELGEKIEEKIVDEKPFTPTLKPTIQTKNPKLAIIDSVIAKGEYLAFAYQGANTVVKPTKVIDSILVAFCYVKNVECSFNIYEMSDLRAKENYYTLRLAGPTIGIDKISNAINTAITYKKLIRMKYTRASWSQMRVDPSTGNLIMDKTEAEESTRTISNVQLAVNALAQEEIAAYKLDCNYITAFCNKKNAERVFKFSRIGEIEILDL